MVQEQLKVIQPTQAGMAASGHANPVQSDNISWETIGRSKREAVLRLLPSAWKLASVPTIAEVRDATIIPQQHLSDREFDITQRYDVAQLAQKIADATFTAREVTEAFCHRATIAHQLTNCLSEVAFEDALRQASALDEYLRIHGKTVGPLHGVPISLKDQFRVKDLPTSVGFISWLKHIETEDSESWLVKQLRAMGAIIYCKTNVPTSLMAIETNNNIIGLTTNALNRELSCGGSSGGEASLLAMRGSILGLGSDVGASIRLPCGYADLAGLKPSHGRIPYLGVANSMEGHQTVESVIGPMSHSITSLRLMTKLILSTSPWLADPKVLHLPWRPDMEEETNKAIESKKLRFAYMRTDGMVTPHPPIQRAVDSAVQQLRAAGYEVVEWNPPAHARAFQILWDTFAADGGTDIFRQLAGKGAAAAAAAAAAAGPRKEKESETESESGSEPEPPVPELAISYGPKPGHLPVGTVNDLWTTQAQKYQYQAEYLAYWQSTGTPSSSQTTPKEEQKEQKKEQRPIDALITPTAATTSHLPQQGRYFGYTGVFNVLDYSACTIRTNTRVDPVQFPHTDGQPYNPNVYTALNPLDAEIAAQYHTPARFTGMPVGLQVVCRRLEEEKVLCIADEVQRVLLSDSSSSPPSSLANF